MLIWIVFVIGLIFRLVLLNQSFWLDEGASLMLARSPLLESLSQIKADFHPPLFYWLLHSWLPLAGTQEWLIRLPFAVIGALTVPLLYRLCQKIFGGKSHIPLYSALLLSLNPLHIYYSQELRMYSLATFLVVLSWSFLLSRRYWLVSVVNFLSVFTFYGAIFNLFSQSAYLIYQKAPLSKHFMVWLLTAVGFLFWWPVFSFQLANGGYLQTALPGWSELSGNISLKSLFLIPLKFIIGRVSVSSSKLLFLSTSLICFLLLSISVYSVRNKKSLPVWLGLLTPLFLGLVISLKTPILGYWRFLYVLPFFLVLIATGIEKMSHLARYALLIWVCGVFIFFNFVFWRNPDFHREDWRGLVQYFSNQNTAVVIPFPGLFAPLHHYRSNTTTYILAQDTLGHNRENLAFILTQSLQSYSKILVMDYLSDLTDPDRKILGVMFSLGLTETRVYNFKGLGQVHEFQKL